MALTPIPAFSSSEDIDSTRLNNLISNQEWLADNIGDMKYMAYGENVSEGLGLAAGVVAVGPAETNIIRRYVEFGRFFQPGSHPVVITGIATTTHTRTWTGIKSPDGTRLKPSSSGFTVTLVYHTDAEKFGNIIHLHWMAVGPV